MNINDKKKALRLFHYGLFILTGKGAGTDAYAASTVTWVSQASFEPPLVMVALRKDSWTNEAVRQSGFFALNIIGKDQKEMAGKFFKEIKINGNMINGFEFDIAETGAPIFKETVAFIECRTVERFEKGDHSVVIAEVVNAGLRRDNPESLILRDTGWNYGG